MRHKNPPEWLCGKQNSGSTRALVNMYVCEKRSRARMAYANLIGCYDNMTLITLYFIF